MRVHGSHRPPWGPAAVGLLLALTGVGVASPAAATPLDTLTAAVEATVAAAATGMDVVSTVGVDRRTDLGDTLVPPVYTTVPAGSRVRVHVTTTGTRDYYASIRLQPSGRLLGAAGRNPAAGGGLWSTLSMMPQDWAASFARDRGLSMRTAITAMDTGRMGTGALGADPSRDAVRLILPPYASSAEEFWTGLTVTPSPSGVVIRGTVPRGDGEAEDDCAYTDIAMVVRADSVIESSRWTATCPGAGVRTYVATATYGPQPIQVATRPRVTMEAALMRRVAGADPRWSAITAAAHRTMVDPGASVRAVEEIRRPDGTSVAFTIDADDTQRDPATGMAAFTETVDGQPDAGWNPVDGWWLAVPPVGSEPSLDAALAAAGQAAARFVVGATRSFVDRYAGVRWSGADPGLVQDVPFYRARALADLDGVILAGEAGRVSARGGGYSVRPAARGYLADLGGTRVLSAAVAVDGAGRIVATTLRYDDGDYRNGRYVYDGRVDLIRVSRISAGAVSPAGVPNVTYAQLQPFLP